MAIDYIPYIRKKIGHDRLLSVGLTALIENEYGEILFEKRTDNGLYCLPGGSIDLDETVTEGLIREVKEETGIDISNPVLFSIYSGNKNSLHYPNGDVTDYVSLNFYIQIKKSDATLHPDKESSGLFWLSKEKIPPKEELLLGQDVMLSQYEEFKKTGRVIVD